MKEVKAEENENNSNQARILDCTENSNGFRVLVQLPPLKKITVIIDGVEVETYQEIAESLLIKQGKRQRLIRKSNS